jgi:hypothetical protein
MKLFFYKSLVVFFLFLLAFHLSFGFFTKKIKTGFKSFISKDKAEEFKIKIREEMQNATSKENYIKPQDAIIINKFLEKIKSDLKKIDN